jgi:hypothetical protein
LALLPLLIRHNRHYREWVKMAASTIKNGKGFVDKRRGRTNSSTTQLAEEANYDNVSSLRTRLTAISAARYPASKLDAMTVNDMVYALRVETGDSAGIK